MSKTYISKTQQGPNLICAARIIVEMTRVLADHVTDDFVNTENVPWTKC